MEASATNQSELCGDGITTTGGTESILLAGILNKSEDTRTVNTNTHTNDEKVQVSDDICSDSESNEGSNCDTED